MTDIRGVSGVNPADFSQPKIRRVDRPEEVQPVQDKLEISSINSKAIEVAQVTEAAKLAPEIRVDVVEAARQKLQSGAYLDPGVTRAVAEKIIDSV